MNKETTIKINYLLRFISKIELCKLMQISRGSLYLKLKNNKWNAIHVIIIDRVFLKIENVKSVVKMNFKKGELVIYYSESTHLSKIIYPM